MLCHLEGKCVYVHQLPLTLSSSLAMKSLTLNIAVAQSQAAVALNHLDNKVDRLQSPDNQVWIM